MPESFEKKVNRVLRDHEGFTGDGRGGVGELPIGDRSTARKSIDNRGLRELFLAPIGYATLAEAAADRAEIAAAAASGVTPYPSFAAARDAGAKEYIIINGRIYNRAPDGPYLAGDGSRWAPSVPDSVASRPLLVLAAGQSNMLGGSGTTTGDRRTLNGLVYVWEQIPGAGQTQGWKCAGPSSPDWPWLTTGNSLAYHFCDLLQRATGRPVYLVMHAAGGQPIAEFLPNGGGVAGATGHMFNALNSCMVAARAATLPTGGTLGGWGIARADIMLWHQGEADADYTGTTGAQWIARFRTLLNTLRTGAGTSATPMLQTEAPVLVGELLHGGDSGGNPTDSRNTEIARLNREEALVAAVSSANLASGDNLHFTGYGLQEFARRYFERLGVFPKNVPAEISTNTTRIAGRAVTLRGAGVVVPAGGDVIVTLPNGIVMANSGYVPALTLTAHGASTPYPPLLGVRTTTTFVVRNTGGQAMMVDWSITDIAAT